MWLRDAVLRSAGFDVLTTLDPKVGLAHIERGHCGVLLMCYSLPLLSRKRLAESFGANCPNGRIVTISESERTAGVCRLLCVWRGGTGSSD
jgi:DNA-binding NarL/FixJ family response regulator